MKPKSKKYILWYKEISVKDVPLVGGKNASLGEMFSQLTRKGVNIPDGFALTSKAYWYFLKKNGIDRELKKIFNKFNPKSLKSLEKTGKVARQLILKAELPKDLRKGILENYKKLSQKYSQKNIDVAVRSSATAEDLPSASFAGLHETYLNVVGPEELLKAVKESIASLFTNRAIAYREEKRFDHLKIALSVGIQRMIGSGTASAGVMFTLDTETGFPNVVLINSIFGIGEMIVKGLITPDQFYVFKPTFKKGFKSIISKDLGRKTKKYIYDQGGGLKEVKVSQKDQSRFSLTDKEVLTLAKWAQVIENHYSKRVGKWMPQDIEWAKDGRTGQLFIVQSRPETVHAVKAKAIFEEYQIKAKKEPILTGIAVGDKIGQGKTKIISDVSKLSQFKKGEVLVTKMTDPDWVSVFPLASAIVTDEGGKTCFSGDTKVLTDKGPLPIKDIVNRFDKEIFKALSLNKETLKLEWKKVIDVSQRKSSLIRVKTSQTGRMRNNILKVTPDHKFLTFDNRKLVSEKISSIIRKEKGIVSALKISSLPSSNLSPKSAYLLGAIITDGHVRINNKNAQTSFIQKPTEAKKVFIRKVERYFFDEYKYNLHLLRKRPGGGIIKGRKIKGGGAIALSCYKKEIARDILDKQKNISQMLLKADNEFIFNFLAGVVDGDGTYNRKQNRINIYCYKEKLLEAISLSCLRLGINFQVSSNRTVYNIQIVDKIEEIFKYTARVKGEYRRTKFGTRFFSARQLLEDIIEKVNYRGRIRPYVDYNLLIDAIKIKDYVIPLIKGLPENHSLTKIINSPLKMLRVNSEGYLGVRNVYNIEVENNHNYIVFTNRYTPIVVENCHAAIVARELGIPSIVGAKKATKVLNSGQEITVDCTQGLKGRIFLGKIPFKVKRYNLKKIPKLKTKILINIGAPEIAFKTSFLPNDGVGLAREEFVIAEKVRIHPLALYHFNKIKDGKVKREIERLTVGYRDKKQYFVDKLAEGVAQIAAAFWPKPVIVRLSDFKTKEYRGLIGGEAFEEEEANPMLGFRGASRYLDKGFQPAFRMECQAIKKVREEFGLKNIVVMIPFCRTVEEGKKVVSLMKRFGLEKGKDGLRVIVMCEIPSNVILAEEFLKVFDGMSIGSNDLTQLLLGMDRDNARIAYIADERNPAVKEMISRVIKLCRQKKKYCGICGDAPSSLPDFANFLLKNKIPSMSLTPDAVIKTILYLAKRKK